MVTYNVNLEIWTTAQREARKVSLHIFSAYNLDETNVWSEGSFVRIDILHSQSIPVLNFRDQMGFGL